jgi:phosphoribosylamine--glycine ligase
MQVCVVGGGGREHALALALGRTADVVVTPGNPGIPGSVPASPEEIEADLFVVGPEAPLVAGLADRLRAQGRRVFGPGADGAQLEGSKAWMKQLFVDAAIPTARHGSFGELEPALAFLAEMPRAPVVKTDGLAAGKGVVVPTSFDEARDAVRSYLSGDAFGDAGRTVVIEEQLSGPELSVFAVCDGRRAVLAGSARDHKRVGDGDTGPNTGGMGAFSPVPGVDDELERWVLDHAIQPTMDELVRRGIDYRGFLYCGLMLTPDGPKVLEYNVRFGDPEAQVVLPRITDDLAAVLDAAADGAAPDAIAFDDGAAVTVVCASEGYPTSPRRGDVIEGLGDAGSVAGVTVFSAGVAERDEALITAGGRVLSVTGQAPDLATARARAYEGVSRLCWPGIHFRSDIAEVDRVPTR